MIKVTAVGRLTKDPTFTQTTSGVDITRLTIACKSKNKLEDGSYKSDFLNCVAWRTQAENIMQFCKKGDLVSVSGSLGSRVYETEGGSKLVWELTIEDIEYLTTKAERESSGGKANSKAKVQDFEEVDDDNLPF
jgi:single-strand DNA-binding protein